MGCRLRASRPRKGRQPELEDHADVTIQPWRADAGVPRGQRARSILSGLAHWWPAG